jgi:hypothetical protein
MIHRAVHGLLTIALCCLSISVGAVKQGSNPWYGRMAKPRDFDPPKTFANTFSIELPKNWQLVPGHTGTVFLVAQNTKRFESGAAIILEYHSLQAAYDPTLIDALAPIEFTDVKSRELSGSNFTQQVLKEADRSLILIQYDRPSLSGSMDHVVQYWIPTGMTMYVLVCIAPSGDTQKWQPIFAHTAASFTILKPGA